jgi:serine palmitoyltransferase
MSQAMPNVYNLGYHAGSFFAELAFCDKQQILQNAARAPVLYKDWWLNMVAKDPIHVLVETSLLIAILYFLVNRNKETWKTAERDKLSAKEESELLLDWKTNIRKPLAPPTLLPHQHRVVHRMDGRTLQIRTSEDAELTTVLNFSTMDFLGRSSGDPLTNPIKQAAQKALDKYGCGSCGPRGFYGTVDVHLDLEAKFAAHLSTDDAILYSDGASTCSSTIAAFCKRGDLLVCDDAIYEPLTTGVALSRANVKWFQHNDMADLRRVLEQVQATDMKLGRKSNEQKRFLVVEGIYKNTGKICPLDEITKLKHEFRYRLILDESNSFGVLGPTGRGVTELYGKIPMRDVEITTISLENAVGSIGGITTGSEEIVDHQRLSGSGYCFSASSPPFTATAAITSLEMMQTQPETLQQLRKNLKYLYSKLDTFCKQKMEEVLVVTSDERSPLVFLQVANISETESLNKYAFLEEVVKECVDRGVAFVAVPTEPSPAIRMSVSAVHTFMDIDTAVQVLGESVDVVLGRLHEAESN